MIYWFLLSYKGFWDKDASSEAILSCHIKIPKVAVCNTCLITLLQKCITYGEGEGDGEAVTGRFIGLQLLSLPLDLLLALRNECYSFDDEVDISYLD